MTDSQSTKHEQFEAETGQEVPRTEKRMSAPISDETPSVSDDRRLGNKEEEAKKLTSEETTGQPSLAAAATLSKGETHLHQEPEPPSYREKPYLLNFGLHSSSREELSNRPMSDLTEIERNLSQPQQNYGEDSRVRAGLKYKLQGQSPMSASLQSLPASFSPAATPRSPHAYLGYNPLRIPELTMSQPDLPNIQTRSVDQIRAREDMLKLREATVRVCVCV